MQLSTELTPCACWTVWRWSPGRRGWRLPEQFFTWLKVSPHHFKMDQHWSRRLFLADIWQICFSQGTFAECSSEAEVQHWMRYNIFLLLDVGTFSALVELLNMEIEYVLRQFSSLTDFLRFKSLVFAIRCKQLIITLLSNYNNHKFSVLQ